MKNPTHVLLADDHHIVVDGLKEILNTIDNIVVAGVAFNGKMLLDLTRTTPADLIILDINMPEMDGIQCTQILKQEFPQIKILILTMYDDRHFINEMIKVGADGCVLKSKGAVELREAIARVMQNKSYFDSIVDFKVGKQEFSGALSPREIEIIKWMVKGKSNQDIGEILFISEHTVKTHRKNIFKKLQVSHISQLTVIAMRRGWG